ncbi:hypothetical protein ASF03_02190 [Rhizobium sp. Leaf68]|nr:hypothetical protein ASF03_02190 [Rhizobium sp. Leaf68]
MATETRKREGQQLLLRFTDGSDLRDRLDECARANNRSLTGEILFRLEASLQTGIVTPVDENPVKTSDFARLEEKVKRLEERLANMEKHRW